MIILLYLLFNDSLEVASTLAKRTLSIEILVEVSLINSQELEPNSVTRKISSLYKPGNLSIVG